MCWKSVPLKNDCRRATSRLTGPPQSALPLDSNRIGGSGPASCSTRNGQIAYPLGIILREQSAESFLIEMPIRRQGVNESARTHQDEADGITK